MAQRMIEVDDRETPFKDNKPGHGWLKLFLIRNPRVAEYYGHRKNIVITTQILDKWFKDLKEFLRRE